MCLLVVDSTSFFAHFFVRPFTENEAVWGTEIEVLNSIAPPGNTRRRECFITARLLVKSQNRVFNKQLVKSSRKARHRAVSWHRFSYLYYTQCLSYRVASSLQVFRLKGVHFSSSRHIPQTSHRVTHLHLNTLIIQRFGVFIVLNNRNTHVCC